jgi:hypothetical protein
MRIALCHASRKRRSAYQALSGLAQYIGPSCPGLEVNRVGFGHPDTVTDPPEYHDCRLFWLDNLESARDRALLRRVFVASQTVRDLRSLTSLRT